jgi:hypothetical protein
MFIIDIIYVYIDNLRNAFMLSFDVEIGKDGP